MKKIDLNVYLNGSLNPTLANKILSYESRSDLICKNASSEEEYLSKTLFADQLLQTREHLFLFTKQLAEDLMEDGVIYAEIHFCPFTYTKIMDADEVIETVLEALGEVKDIKTKIVLCMQRKFNQDINLEIVKLAKKYSENGVVGLSLLLDESNYRLASYKQLFDIISIENIPLSVHLGSQDTKEDILFLLSSGVKRISWVPIIDDELMSEISGNITVGISPTYLIDSALINNLDYIPLKRYIASGYPVIISPYYRTISNVNLEDEYELLKNNYKLTVKDLNTINKNAVKGSFLSKSEKAELISLLKDK